MYKKCQHNEKPKLQGFFVANFECFLRLSKKLFSEELGSKKIEIFTRYKYIRREKYS